MCERVGLGKMSECGENRHTKIWIAQLWKPMDRAYANIAAPLKILTDSTFLKLPAK